MTEEPKIPEDILGARGRKLADRLKRIFYYWRLRLQRLKATPHQIGMGVAVGVFAGHLPVLPMQTILALLLAWPLNGNKIAAALATSVTNPLTTVPLHILFYRIGKALVPFDVVPIPLTLMEPAALVQAGWELYATLCVGALIVATPCAILSYFLAKRCAEIYQNRKRGRRSRQSYEGSKPS